MANPPEPLIVNASHKAGPAKADTRNTSHDEWPAPHLFPEGYWDLVDPKQRPLVEQIYGAFTTERLQELLEQIRSEVGIYKDDCECQTDWYNKSKIKNYEARTERDFFLAQCFANIDVFGSPDPDNPPRVKNYQVRVETTDEIPVRARPRRFNLIEQAFLEAKTNLMVQQHKLRDSHSDWSHGLVLVPYRDRINRFLDAHGDEAHTLMFSPQHAEEVSSFYRLCSDMREVNKKTKLDIFPLPRIDDIIDNIPVGTDRYSTGDVKDAFFCVEIHPDDRKKLAFRTHNRHLEFEVMVQGWVNSPSHFCRVIETAMRGVGRFQASAYLDDILNHTGGFLGHFMTQQEIYNRLRTFQLMFKPSKTHINHPKIKFLGHILSEGGIAPDPDKVKAVANIEDPRDVTGVRSFLGSTLFYRRFIHGYSDLAAPLYALTQKGANVRRDWNDSVHGAAMDGLKAALTSAPVLRLFDPSKPIQIRLDACKVGRGIGAIFLQPDEDNEWHPIEYWSKALSDAERNYAATELECKVLHDALMHWHMYVNCGQRVDVYTDHNALLYMVEKSTATNNGRLLHYLMDLQGYRFTLHYKKGELHSDADWISRAWHITDFIAETREDLDTAIGPVQEDSSTPAPRDWGAANRLLRKLQRVRQSEHLAKKIVSTVSQLAGGEEGVDHNFQRDISDIDHQEHLKFNPRCHECESERQIRSIDNDDVLKLVGMVRQFVANCDESDYSWLDKQDYCAEAAINKEIRKKIMRKVEKKINRVMTGRYVLRDRSKPVDYKEDTDNDSRPRDPNWRVSEEHPASNKLVMNKKCGFKNLKVLKSTIEGAGWGLFSTAVIDKKDIICSYEGARFEGDYDESSAGEGKDYVAMAKMFKVSKDGKITKEIKVYVDSWEEDSCYGRYVNDPLNDHLVNARIVMRGDKMVLVALEEIRPGQEIFISYGEDYWKARQHLLPTTVEGERTQDPKKVKKSVRFSSEAQSINFSENDMVTKLRLKNEMTTVPVVHLE